MARGYPGAFGGPINAPWIWIAPLACCSPRPSCAGRCPWCISTSLALLAFSVSYAAFNRAALDVSVADRVPAARLCAGADAVDCGAWSSRHGRSLACRSPCSGGGLVFLLGFRVAVSLSAPVIDVGYAGVIGADQLTRGLAAVRRVPRRQCHGDTYGPVLVLAYVPLELLFPWSGAWDSAAGRARRRDPFDLACVALSWLLGRRLGGNRLGLLLAYLWAAYPFTLLVLASGANDALVAALVLATILLVSERPLLAGRRRRLRWTDEVRAVRRCSRCSPPTGGGSAVRW